MIQPKNNHLIVELVSYNSTKSGLELVSKEEDKGLRVGKVVSSSVDDLKKDNLIVFGRYAYETLLFEGQEFAFLNYEDVIGLITK